MKKILFMLITLVSLSTFAKNDNSSTPANKDATKAMAKEFKDKTPDERAKSITDMLNEKLKLSVTQYKSTFDINVKYAKLNDNIFNQGYSKMQLFSKLKSVNTTREKEIMALLDSKQQETFQQEKSAMISQFKSMRKN